MKFDEILYDQARLALNKKIDVPFKGFDVWVSDGSPRAFLRHEDVKENELSAWLEEKDAFKRPAIPATQAINGRLRLIYQKWPAKHDMASNSYLPMSEEALNKIVHGLDLPRSFLIDFASRKSVPLRLKRSSSQQSIGIIWQSPPLKTKFMTMAIKYDQATNTTHCYLGFQSTTNEPKTAQPTHLSPGDRLLTLLELVIEKAHDPMLLPALAAGLWIDYMHNVNHDGATMLREIQIDIGLMDSYLQPMQKLIQQPTQFDDVHRKIVVQHGYLTNGLSEFITDLFPATVNAMDVFRGIRHPQLLQPLLSWPGMIVEVMQELDEYISHMCIRARTELQHHDRMLSRINVYLQVLYSLMQQKVAQETKRDASAMKSIALLTMVFLPATAIATIIAPFLKTDNASGSQFTMMPQFYVFWAIAVPVTIVVLLLWIVWSQRAEIVRFFSKMGKRGSD